MQYLTYTNQIVFSFEGSLLRQQYFADENRGDTFTENDFFQAKSIAEIELGEIEGDLDGLAGSANKDVAALFNNKTLNAMFPSSLLSSLDLNNNEPLILKDAKLDEKHKLKLIFNKNLLRIKKKYVDRYIDETIIYLGA